MYVCLSACLVCLLVYSTLSPPHYNSQYAGEHSGTLIPVPVLSQIPVSPKWVLRIDGVRSHTHTQLKAWGALKPRSAGKHCKNVTHCLYVLYILTCSVYLPGSERLFVRSLSSSACLSDCLPICLLLLNVQYKYIFTHSISGIYTVFFCHTTQCLLTVKK